MTEEQLTLIAQILNVLCNEDAVLPYRAFGANLGKCRYCGAVGRVQYPDVVYMHGDTCITELNRKLQESLQKEK